LGLARTYELKKDWSSARQSYEQLAHCDPGNVGWQSKIDELAGKN
jgi:hypothetical protein